jgi:hypothetical protein
MGDKERRDKAAAALKEAQQRQGQPQASSGRAGRQSARLARHPDLIASPP